MQELIDVARSKRIPLVFDEGSGRVVSLSRYGLTDEPTLRDVVGLGVDVVTCSTDKLIGSVQGGLILGTKEIIDRCASHPLMRALRPGKESFELVVSDLKSYLRGKEESEIPLYRMLSTPLETLRSRAESLATETGSSVIELESVIGGGTTPTETVPSVGLRVEGHAERIRKRLREANPPVIARIQADEVVLDLRTVGPTDDENLGRILSGIDRG